MRECKEQKYIIPTALTLIYHVEFVRVNLRSSSFQYKHECDIIKKYESDIGSYAHDNTPNIYDSDLCTVLSKLKSCTDSLLTWFKENRMKPKVISATSLLQLKNQLVSTLTEAT